MTQVDKITLISQSLTHDSIGQQIPQETGNTVICTVSSITRNEWITANQKSLSAAYLCKVFFRDYAAETIAEFRGKRYEIYRTYQAGDKVELYLGERVGELSGTP